MLLKFIRKHTKLLFIIILTMIVFPFLFWGIGSIGRQTAEKEEPLTARGKKVSLARLKEASLDSQIRLLIDFVEGNNIRTSEQFEIYKEWFNRFLNQMDFNRIAVQEIILEDEAKGYGITVSNEEIKNWIINFPLFQTGGSFDPEKYNLIVANFFHTWPAQFETALARVLNVIKLRRFISDTVLVSDNEVLNAYKERNEKVIVYYAEFPASGFIKDAADSGDTEIEEFYNSHKQDFMNPERIKISYLVFDQLNYKNDISASQKEIEDYYEANKKEFTISETESKPIDSVSGEIKQKIIDEKANELAREKALEASIELTKEKRIGDMFNLAREKGLELKETDYLVKEQTFIPELGPAQEIMQGAWEMETGTISDIISVGNKWVIISASDKKPSEIRQLNEVGEKIKEILKIKKAEELAMLSAEETVKKIPKDKPFNMALKSIGLKVKKSKPVTKTNELFTRSTEVKKTEKGAVLVHMYKLFPVDEKKWEKEKEGFAKNYLEQKKRRFFQEWLAKITAS